MREILITSFNHLKISELFSILICLSFSNEKNMVKSVLLNGALKSSGFDIFFFVGIGVVLFLRLFSGFVPFAKAW